MLYSVESPAVGTSNAGPVNAGSRGFDSHRRHMFERFFRSNRPGYPQPVCSELQK